jgi:hypothetical protein
MDQNKDILARAKDRDPQTGLFVMSNITPQDVLDTSLWNPLLSIVQSKTVPVNIITTTENETLFLLQQVLGVIALFTDGDYNLAMVGFCTSSSMST